MQNRLAVVPEKRDLHHFPARVVPGLHRRKTKLARYRLAIQPDEGPNQLVTALVKLRLPGMVTLLVQDRLFADPVIAGARGLAMLVESHLHDGIILSHQGWFLVETDEDRSEIGRASCRERG